MITQEEIKALLENTGENFSTEGFGKLIAVLKELSKGTDEAEQKSQTVMKLSQELLNALNTATSATIKAYINGETDLQVLTEKDYAVYIGCIYTVCSQVTFMKKAAKKRYNLCAVPEQVRAGYVTELLQPYTTIQRTGAAQIDWVESAELWKACVQNTVYLLYPDLREMETQDDKPAEKGPFEQFKERLQVNVEDLYDKLNTTITDAVKNNCTDWVRRTPIGVLYMDGRQMQIKNVALVNGKINYTDAKLQTDLFPRLPKQLGALCCILDDYGVQEYSKLLNLGGNISVNVNLAGADALLPSANYTYLPALQCCLRNKIGIRITDRKKDDGAWSFGINVEVVNTLKKLQDVMFDLFLFVLYKASDTDATIIPWNELETCDDMAAAQQLADDCCDKLVSNYGTPLFYGYSIYDATDAQIDYVANYGAYVTTDQNIITLTTFLSQYNGNKTRAKFWFGKEMAQMQVLPDKADLLCLRGNFINSVEVYYQKADFGYEANHRLYRNGLSKDAPLVIAKRLTGGDFTLDLKSQNVGGIGIIAGSRSGKGVCTNNIVGNLLARGHSLAYIDGKPEQALALWAFEKTFNAHFRDKLKRSLKLIVVDPMYPLIDKNMLNSLSLGESIPAPEVVIPDDLPENVRKELEELVLNVPETESELNTPPRMCRIHSLPDFITSEDFKEFRREHQTVDLLARPYIFNYIRVLKVLHLLLGYVQVKSRRGNDPYKELQTQCYIKKQRKLTDTYAFVAWDELNRWNVNFAPYIQKLHELVKFLNVEISKLEKTVAAQTEKKKQNNPELCAKEVKDLKNYKKYYAYFSRMLQCYAIYNEKGSGLEDGSDIAKGFNGIKTDTLVSNVRFIAIMQSICTKTENKLPCNFFEMLPGWKLICGKNYNGTVAGANPFTLENATNAKDSIVEKQCTLATAGTLDSLFPGTTGEVSGYFTYRDSAKSKIEVIKTYLTLLDNDYVEDTETHAAPEGGGTYNSSNGGAAVANLLSRTASNLRDYVLQHDVYKNYDKRELNAELGFGGATEWLIMQAANNDYEELQKLVDGMNMLYDDLLVYVNYYREINKKPTYTQLEDYFADMSYDSMFTFEDSGALTEPTKMPGLSLGCPEETEEVVSSGPNYGNYDNIEFSDMQFDADTNAGDMQQDNSMSEIPETDTDTEQPDVAEDLSEDISDAETEDVEDINAFTAQEITKPLTRSMQSRSQPAQSMQPIRKPDNPSAVPQGYTASMETTGDMFSIAVEDDISMHGLYGREKLTKALLKIIAQFVGGDYTLVTSFKIDDAGHIFINNVMIAPQLTATMMDDVPPLLQRAVKRNSWSDMFDCRKLYLFKNLQYLEIAGNRSVSAGRELGVGNNWELLLQARAKRKFFPALETVIIDGIHIGAEETAISRAYDACSNVADTFKAQIGIGGVADKVWRKSPVRTCVKALGYGAGLKLFWGVAALMGPVGLLAATVGTAAVAMKEYDKFQVERKEIRSETAGNRKVTNTDFMDTENVEKRESKSRKRNKTNGNTD